VRVSDKHSSTDFSVAFKTSCEMASDCSEFRFILMLAKCCPRLS
jgi:hypothetical protein